MFVKTKNFNSEELAQFLELQKLSFSILQSAASRLMGGETEKEVARQLVKDYYSAGFTSFFIYPLFFSAKEPRFQEIGQLKNSILNVRRLMQATASFLMHRQFKMDF
jgi:hypothetical protein